MKCILLKHVNVTYAKLLISDSVLFRLTEVLSNTTDTPKVRLTLRPSNSAGNKITVLPYQ